MSNTIISAYAALQPGASLVPYQFDAGELQPHQVEVKVEYCGLCHSDISVINNDWHNSIYPVIAGHEIIGTITQLGTEAKGLKIGQRVGIGWTAESCQYCHACISGHAVQCSGTSIATIVGHAGGFANKVRAGWQWIIPLPDDLAAESAGPLLCGGITVFDPILKHQIQAIHHVGVIGIGGLGHIAIKLLKAWGCEITAFTSNLDKTAELKAMGADHVIDSHDREAIKMQHGKFDLLLSTVNVSLDWKAYLATLAPEGTLHMLGLVLEPMSIAAGHLIGGAKSVSGSATGSPAALRQLLQFAARKNIAPTIEMFPMSKINEAIQRLESGQARYRIVLQADFT
ncbi:MULTISPECIES: NAD(P)-dependent alcohol dehydrogenase [unclassified Acinetobacter]|uniref:NADPH-dependent aldehyde reductase Ahr n=1 Tax=unclassified Acinetobacter TaxID=196816 RepID=UPI0029352DE6|nr:MULTISPECIES: NAD(P)-dependent alcohol dehydrogenase [unclassified Acinetobacter]WOE30796.1 NAD(P)-dependent alcohol dehydrogenase [Acinetobacter sp. SAAs470]WOE38990.1 NAD(P)-dependent alcohol dehydrogenase [Acinetobacter sp. SAAs474]